MTTISPMAENDLYRCSLCRQDLPREAFYGKARRYSWCRSCAVLRRKGLIEPPASLASRIEDLLAIDGGWLGADYLTERLNADPSHVKRTLYRLRARGAVQSRLTAAADCGGRNEWRAV